jgi:hypothetical protein
MIGFSSGAAERAAEIRGGELAGSDPTAASPARELWADLFLERMSPEIRAGLTPQQLAEIRRVAAAVAPGAHRVDWRVSLPLLGPLFGGKRVYGVLLAGSDRRGPARRQQDRMIRRRMRAGDAPLNAQVLAVGFSLMALFFMVLLGLTHVG